MKYRVLEPFYDRHLKRKFAKRGEPYPPARTSVPKEWLERLLTSENDEGRPFIEAVSEEKENEE